MNSKRIQVEKSKDNICITEPRNIFSKCDIQVLPRGLKAAKLIFWFEIVRQNWSQAVNIAGDVDQNVVSMLAIEGLLSNPYSHKFPLNHRYLLTHKFCLKPLLGAK